MSNAIRYDSLLVHYLARELDARLRGHQLRGVRLDSDARRLILDLEGERLVWELHPTRGWIRTATTDPAAAAQAAREAVEGWAGRAVAIQRRARVRRVFAPLDERWLEIEVDAGGADRASSFVIELMTNQWNVLALAPDRTILSALRTRDAGGRTLRAGAPYPEPGMGGRPRREGAEQPISLDRWLDILGSAAPGDRARTLVRTVAWISPLNAPTILAPADGGDDADADSEPLTAAWRRYVALAERPEASPRVVEVGRPAPYPLPLPDIPDRPVPSLLDAFGAVLDASARSVVAPEVRATIEDRLDRARRRADRLRSEAADAPARAAGLRRQADLLMAQLHRVDKGAARATLDDFEGGEATVELDPALSPVDNAQALYRRARKRDRAAERLPRQIRRAEAEASRIEALLSALDQGAASDVDLAGWLDEMKPGDATPTTDEGRLPYRRFRSSGGLEIRVGRTGRANDDLTFRHASPDDIWLHARDTAGAHVILRWPDRVNRPPQRDLVEAAVLAALNSRARTSGTVPVDWTRRKYVRKPRKAAAGAVIPDQVATLFVEPDPDLPARLAER